MECSQIIKVNREDFFEILAKYPDDLERFMMIRDSLLFYNDYELSNMNCYSCGKCSHLIKNCPYLVYCPDRDLVIKREIYSQPQKRKTYARRNKKSLNSLIIKNDLEELINIKRKADKNDIITVFFNHNSMVETFPIDESLSNLDNSMNPENFSQGKNSKASFSFPSQVGILKHYRQSRDFTAKRSVSFLAQSDFEKPIKEEKINEEENKSQSSSNSSEEEKNNGNILKEDKEEKKNLKNWEFDFNLSEKEGNEEKETSSERNARFSLSVNGNKLNELRFDKVKSFRFYFPYNNLEEIIAEINKIKKKKIRLQQFYFRKAMVLNKISKMLAKQKRRSRAGVKNKILGKTFNFFKIVQRKIN